MAGATTSGLPPRLAGPGSPEPPWSRPGEDRALDTREGLGQGVEGGPDEGRALHVPAHQQDVGGHVGEGGDGSGHLGEQQRLVAQGRGELAHGDGAGDGLGVLLPHRRVSNGHQQPPRHDPERPRGQVEPAEAGDQRVGHLAVGHLLVEAVHPAGVAAGGVHQQGWLVDGDLADRRGGAGGLQGDQRADADPEHLLRAGVGHHGLQVFDLGAHAVVRAVRAGQAAAAPVGQVHGELIGQRQRELGVAAGRLVAAMQHHHSRAMAGLQIANRGPVGGRDHAGGHLGGAGGVRCGSSGGVHLILLLVLR